MFFAGDVRQYGSDFRRGHVGIGPVQQPDDVVDHLANLFGPPGLSALRSRMIAKAEQHFAGTAVANDGRTGMGGINRNGVFVLQRAKGRASVEHLFAGHAVIHRQRDVTRYQVFH